MRFIEDITGNYLINMDMILGAYIYRSDNPEYYVSIQGVEDTMFRISREAYDKVISYEVKGND